jgi:hypothetical protein
MQQQTSTDDCLLNGKLSHSMSSVATSQTLFKHSSCFPFASVHATVIIIVLQR